MAYGLKYELTFKNRVQNDVYRTEIHRKDFVGDSIELTYAEDACSLSTDENEILTAIKSVSFTCNILTDGSVTLLDLYSDDDEAFRVDHYFESIESGGGTEKLLFTGYLNQDGVSESLTDRKHVLALKATDGLALLKSVKWDEACTALDQDFYGKHTLLYFIQTCLTQTGLYHSSEAIDMGLPLRIFSNLYENSTDDRDDDPVADAFLQTVVDAAMFQGTDNTWDDCYTVLEKILTDLNACLCQADGYWNIVRPGEYELFTDGEILGTQYHYDGIYTDVEAVVLLPLVNIARTGGDCYPIEEDQVKSLQRPYKYILNTFDYNKPVNFIRQSDLQLPAGAVPFDTDIDGDLRIDKYDLATYFPDWVSRNGDTSYLEVITDTSVTPENEVERYIHKPADFDVHSGVQFNPIEVTTDDSFDLSLQFRTHHSDGFFWVRFILIVGDGTYYSLEQDTDSVTPDYHLFWDGPFADTGWFNDSDGVRVQKDGEDESWASWSLTQFINPDISVENAREQILIPADGVLLIEVDGNSSTWDTGFGTYATDWKDLQFHFTQHINKSTQIAGQTHKDTGTSTIKATNESDLNIDDSPRNTIAGTLFTDALTNFDATDTDTGETTNIGDVYFTRTHTWHRIDNVEELRLGNIITYERLKLRYTTRLIVEGSFRNLRYADDRFISMLCLFQFGFIADKFFLAKSIEIDYMNCSYRAALVEAYSDADSLSDEYLFQYYYKTD